MRFLSLFSGIEAASVAWSPIGWKAAAFAEIEKFPSAVLAHHYPDVPNLGDVTKFKEWPDLGSIDLVCGGSPCQSFSIAGLRKGLADPRGNLTLTFLAVVDRYRPRWIVWENVPGILSSDGGRAFASFLGGLGQLGYGWCYRVMDAQYARVDGFARAVPQRRRRVVAVGYLGDWRRSAAVLSEPESVLGDTAPRREAGKTAAPTIAARTRGGGGLGTDFDCDGGLIANSGDASYCVTVNGQRSNDAEVETLIAHSIAPPVTHNPYGDHESREGLLVAHSLRGEGFDASAMPEGPHDTANIRAASGGSSRSYVAEQWAVRRLTPTECERLQGFPDGYTAIPWRGKPADQCPDGPRYKALGNSWAINVFRWVGERIDMVEELCAEIEHREAAE